MNWKTGFLWGASLVLVGQPNVLAQRSHGGGAPTAVPSRAPARAASSASDARVNSIRGFLPPIPTSTGLVASSSSYNGNQNGNFRSGYRSNGNRTFRGNNYGVGYGGFYGIPYLPFYDNGSYSSFPGYSEQSEAVTAQANAQMQDSVAQQLDQMNAQINEMRSSQMQGGPPPQMMMQPGQPQWAPARDPGNDLQPAQAPIILIMQNGTRVSVNNYAVMSDTIWDFSKQPARKIPVTSVNVPASEKATEDSGGEFPRLVPSSTSLAR